MFGLLITIARNTFRESVRQPVVLIINGVAVFLLITANPLSAYTLEDDQRMLLDIGLATIFAAGSILAAFVASDAISREIDDKTVLTVVSKPVPRPILVVGKFLGILGVLLMSVLLQSFVFMLAEYHTVLQTVRDPIHLPVLFLGGGAILVGLAVATWMNYFYGRNFPASTMLAIAPLLGIAWVFTRPGLARINPDVSGASGGRLLPGSRGICWGCGLRSGSRCFGCGCALGGRCRLGCAATSPTTSAPLPERGEARIPGSAWGNLGSPDGLRGPDRKTCLRRAACTGKRLG